jgi:plasmid stabilization system protein ParE
MAQTVLNAGDQTYERITHEYLSQFYPGTPGKFLTGMDQIVLNLAENPKMYPVYSPKPGYRKAVVGKYIVFYTVDDENKRVEISRILRGSWDIKKYI